MRSGSIFDSHPAVPGLSHPRNVRAKQRQLSLKKLNLHPPPLPEQWIRTLDLPTRSVLPSSCLIQVFMKIADAGSEPRIFWFSIIFSHKQHLRLLGYCAPPPPQMSCPSLASNCWPVTSAGPLTTSKATNMTTQSTIRAAVQLLHVAAFTFPETVCTLSVFLASLFAMCQLAKWEVTLRPHKLSYYAWPRVLLRCCHRHNIHYRLE